MSFIVQPTDAGKRMDVCLLNHLPNYSRARVQRHIREGGVRADGRLVKPGYVLRGGEKIGWTPLIRAARPVVGESPTPHESPTIALECDPIEALYDDNSFFAINKPRGLVVHRGSGTRGPTLVDLLVAQGKSLAALPGPDRPGIVHRLDKETSGVLLIAKTDEAHVHLCSQFKERQIHKTYVAIVNGIPRETKGVIHTTIGRHPRQRKKMSTHAIGGRPALTEYRVLESYNQFALIELILHTGRTHQIRVHLNHIGHPVVGDPTYGGRKRALHAAGQWKGSHLKQALTQLSGQALHAAAITLRIPDTGCELTIEAPLPQDMHNLLRILRTDS